MSRRIFGDNILNERHERLLVIERVGYDRWGALKVKCQCDCGSIKAFFYKNLKNMRTKSCGCFSNELLILRNRTRTKNSENISALIDNFS